MTERVTRHRLQVATELDRFINERALPETGVDPEAFWSKKKNWAWPKRLMKLDSVAPNTLESCSKSSLESFPLRWAKRKLKSLWQN